MSTEPRRPLPLAHELGQLWAQILVAEYQRRREVATTTVVTPSGSDRRAAQLDRMSPRHPVGRLSAAFRPASRTRKIRYPAAQRRRRTMTGPSP
jgi:hypothetical protein